MSDEKQAFNDALDQAVAIVEAQRDAYSPEQIDAMLATIEMAKEQQNAMEEERKETPEERRAREKREIEERIQKKKEAREAHIAAVTSMDLPLDWENVFATDARTQGVHTESISDALVMSLSSLGRVDIEYISSVTGEDYKTVICALKGSIFQNPDTWGECFYKGWETAEEYLSGNLMRKWKTAKRADDIYRGYFADNVAALGRVLPVPVSAGDIYVTLGSPWVPTDIIDAFITHILHLKTRYRFTKHDELTGTWELPDKAFYQRGVAATGTYGTPRLGALEILERTLNMKTVSVTDEVGSLFNKSGVKRVVNRAETVLALEKQQKLIDTFRKWVFADAARKEKLETIYDEKFGCVRRRRFDGSFLTFPTMSPDITLYGYQKNAVARILFSPNTLLAHDVGSGKTFIMVAAGMEMRRMGISKKNLYVVPNSIVGQWKGIFERLYPTANVLTVEPKHFTPDHREKTLATIRDGDFDAVIMAYSCFDRIPLSVDYYEKTLTEKKKELAAAAVNSKKATRVLKSRLESVTKELAELVATVKSGQPPICFDQLGFTRLFVDEAHNYKNLPLETKVDKVLGISSAGSKKCADMLDKVTFIQRENLGGGVIMATGTPITNSITDAFAMQKYLQGGELAMLDLQCFDSWVGMFAERTTEFEIDVDTSSYRLATRFAKFHNIPELTSLLASVADFHRVDTESGIPAFDGYNDELVPKTLALGEYLEDISRRADAVRSGAVRRLDDNMLKITGDGRKAALDIRLVSPDVPFTHASKVAKCAENVFNIYRVTAAAKSTQLIFCDTSTPKIGLNMYDELRRLLIFMGVPSDEIAFVHDAQSMRARTKLFAKMCRGEIRILLGSTFKLGLGVNIQDKLIAVHHLDVPWRPADMVQREGRILRQGNENKKVYIYRYITEGSFDAYSWQLLETKQRFISGLLSGSYGERSGSEIDDVVLSYAEIKALAIGNPLIKERVETANELVRTATLQRKAVEEHVRMENELMEMPARIEHLKGAILRCRKDAEAYAARESECTAEERRAIRATLSAALADNVLLSEERTLLSYCGFHIVLPTGMTPEKPFVWLAREGRYYVELGESDTGALVRIDNFLDGLGEHLAKLRRELSEMKANQAALEAELAKKEDYTDKIEALKAKLKRIDKKLGVNEK